MPWPFAHLSLEEHRQLARLYEIGFSVAEIVRRLGRHGSTIDREPKCNWWHYAEVPHHALL
jgi:IS30 family transposase